MTAGASGSRTAPAPSRHLPRSGRVRGPASRRTRTGATRGRARPQPRGTSARRGSAPRRRRRPGSRTARRSRRWTSAASSATRSPGRTPPCSTRARAAATSPWSSCQVEDPLAFDQRDPIGRLAGVLVQQHGHGPGHQPPPADSTTNRPIARSSSVIPRPPPAGPRPGHPHPPLLDRAGPRPAGRAPGPRPWRARDPARARASRPRTAGSAAATASPAAIPTPVSNSVLTTTGTLRSAASDAISAAATGPPTRASFTTSTSTAPASSSSRAVRSGGHRLVRGDGDADPPPEFRQLGRVVAGDGLLHVLEREPRDRVEPVRRGLEVPRAVHVQPEPDIGADGRPDRAHPVDQDLGLALRTGLQLERGVARVDGLVGGPGRRLGPDRRDRRVDADAGPAGQETVRRHSRRGPAVRRRWPP